MEMHLGEEGGVGSDLKTRRTWKDRKMEDISGWRAERGLGRRLSWEVPATQAGGREFGHQNPYFLKNPGVMVRLYNLSAGTRAR